MRERNLRRIAVLTLLLVTVVTGVAFATVECYPCTQCRGHVCFILDSRGNTIGEVADVCCSGAGFGGGGAGECGDPTVGCQPDRD
jgi:hypothetical protein